MAESQIRNWFSTLAERRWSVSDRGRSGQWSSYWSQIAAEDPSLASVRMTVELVFGGDRVIRAATEPIETRSSSTGEVFAYAPLLQSEPEISSEISIGGGGAASLRSIGLALDGRLVDPLEIVNGGRILAGYGEVSLQVPGGDWDERLVLLRGDMAGGVSFGHRDEPLDFEIVDPELTSDRLVPPVVMVESSWANGRDADYGRRFPLLLTDHPAVPCLGIGYFAGSTRFAVCLDDPTYTGSSFSVLRLFIDGAYRLKTDATYPWSQTTLTDSGSGARLVVVTVSRTMDENIEVYADVNLTDGRAVSLGGVIKKLLRDHSVVGRSRFDFDLFAATETRLPSGLAPKVLINGSGESDATRAIEYLESTLASDFPMLSFAWTGSGYAPVVVDRRRGLFVADLRRAQYPLIDRLSAVSETPKGDLLNAFTYRFDFNLPLDSYVGVVTRDAQSSLICRISEDAVGRRDGDVIESATVYDSATAAYVADWLVEHRALPHYIVEYEAFSVLALTLRLGDNVYLSDDRLGWERVESTVIGLVYARGRAVVRFAVWLLYRNLPGGAVSGRGITGGGTPGGGGGGGINSAPGQNAQPGQND